jgi:hypothetical protein
MYSNLLRAGLVGVMAAGVFALAGASIAAEVVKPVPRPARAAGPATPMTKSVLPPLPKGQVQTYGYGRIILHRGLMNIWSRGMDTLDSEMRQRGLPVKIYNHTAWQATADALITEYKANKNVLPIIIIGHSLGADAALIMANWLGHNNVPVSLVVTFDGVIDVAHMTAGGASVINYYKPNEFGLEVKAASGFKGTIRNIDLSDQPEINHLNIDKVPSLHDDVIARVLELMKKKPTVTAKG